MWYLSVTKAIFLQIPYGSVLWPDDDAAVVGGNVLTSQRICDVVLKAFRACADSSVGLKMCIPGQLHVHQLVYNLN